MTLSWYEIISPTSSIDQGDIILDCPIAGWKEGPFQLDKTEHEFNILREQIEIAKSDLVVMTQTCDLAENKVSHAVLCPHYPLEEYKQQWEQVERGNGQNPTSKSWGKFLDRVTAGQIWNLTILNEENGSNYSAELRIVDFHEVFSLPRSFLESWLTKNEKTRLRLCPPYREHLSQAFARFFMRVGLPTEIRKTWQTPELNLEERRKAKGVRLGLSKGGKGSGLAYWLSPRST